MCRLFNLLTFFQNSNYLAQSFFHLGVIRKCEWQEGVILEASSSSTSSSSSTLRTHLWMFHYYTIIIFQRCISLKPVLEGMGGRLHLLLSAVERLIQTDYATFVLFWAYYKAFKPINYVIKPN